MVEEDVKPLKKPKSFFGVPSTSSKTITLKSSVKAEAVQVKEEESMDIDPESEPTTSKVSKKSPEATENSNETKAPAESPKASTSSDKKETPKKSPDEQKKVNKKKDIKSLPPVGGKSSIASFFGNKPASTSTIAEKVEPKIEKTKKLEKSEKVQVVELQKSLDVMMISDDEIPCTPEAIKPKKQTKNDSQKRSRIKQIVDSSDEDEPKEEIVKEPESKVAKLNESKKKSSKPETSRKKSKESSKSEKVTESKKVAKKSEKLEKDTEVSVSENESEPTIAQPTEALKPAKENEKPANEKKTAPKPGKKLTKKEMKNQPPGKNQGTITSFFTKK